MHKTKELAEKLVALGVLPAAHIHKFELEFDIMAETIVGTTFDALVALKTPPAVTLPPSPFDKANASDVVAFSAAFAAVNSATPPVSTAPVITSAASATLPATGGTLTVTTTGTPTAKLTTSGTFPGTITFADNANGTGTLTVAATPAGAYSITITADNGVAPAAVQAFSLTLA